MKSDSRNVAFPLPILWPRAVIWGSLLGGAHWCWLHLVEWSHSTLLLRLPVAVKRQMKLSCCCWCFTLPSTLTHPRCLSKVLKKAYIGQWAWMCRNLLSQVLQLEDQALVFLLLKRATHPGCSCLPPLLPPRVSARNPFCLMVAPLPFGPSCLWGWHCLKGTFYALSKNKVLLLQQWRDSYALFVMVCYWSGGDERGAQFGEGKGPMVSLFQAFACSWLGKFGPSRAMRRRLWEYKERLTVGRTRVLVWKLWWT